MNHNDGRPMALVEIMHADAAAGVEELPGEGVEGGVDRVRGQW